MTIKSMIFHSLRYEEDSTTGWVGGQKHSIVKAEASGQVKHEQENNHNCRSERSISLGSFPRDPEPGRQDPKTSCLERQWDLHVGELEATESLILRGSHTLGPSTEAMI